MTEIGSIGIVVPGSIDRSGEMVIAAYNLGFHDVPLRAIMQARFPGVPVYIANDANGSGSWPSFTRVRSSAARRRCSSRWARALAGHHSGWQELTAA